MEDYNQQYPQEEYPNQQHKSIKGLKIMIIILALILGALSTLYFMQVREMRTEFAVEKDTLTSRLTHLLSDMDGLQTENDTITKSLETERFKADSLLTSLKKERNLSRSKIKDYEKRLGLMRNVMETYIHQIDSLNTMNQKLVTENIGYRKEVTSARLRADVAEEKATELGTKVRKGAVLRARNISLMALSTADREVTRASRAARLRVDFVLVGNELAIPGNRNVYVRIIGPDGYVMAVGGNSLFDFEGDMITYSASRSIDYQNEDLSISVFYNGTGITGGKYTVMIYADSTLIGSSEIILR